MNRLSRDNIAQIFVLEVITRPNAAGQAVRQPRQMTNVCVVNTHLYSNHARPDVKLWQSMILMREVENVAVARDIAVIICGDFNSEPDSAVHEFMGTGCLETAHPELEQSDNLGILPNQEDIGHSMEFSSVMEATLGAEPPYTNFTGKFKGTLDYIWYTPGRLRVLAVTNVPDPQDIFNQCGEGLPSASYPSDHIMLCTDIAFSVAGAGTVTRPQVDEFFIYPFLIQRFLTNHGQNNELPFCILHLFEIIPFLILTRSPHCFICILQTHRRHLLTGVGAANSKSKFSTSSSSSTSASSLVRRQGN